MKWTLLIGMVATVTGIASWRLTLTGTQSSRDSLDRCAAAPAAVEIHGIGYVEPVSELRKLMLRTGGVVKRCFVNVGDTVRKDQPILELEDATQRAEVDLARKNLELAQASAAHVTAGINPYRLKAVEQTVERLREKLRHGRSEAERHRRLIATRSTSAQEYDAVETLRRQSELELKEQEAELEHLRQYITPEHQAMLAATVRHAQAQLAWMEQRLRETKLVAPFDGQVLKLLKREGEGVSAFDPEAVVLFGDLSRLRVRAEIDERFVRRVAVGQRAVVHGRNLDGISLSGQVASLEPIMGDKTLFTHGSSERKDLDVLQVIIDLGADCQAPVGLQVDVVIETE